jgi:Ca2+-binding EF-hand superfamily protein
MLTELQKRKLIKFFSMYDANYDGVLVCQDFENIIKKLATLRNFGTRSSKYQLLMDKCMHNWKSLKGGADTSRDKKVCIEEWLNYYDGVLSEEKKYNQEVRYLMELIFEVFDGDGDGKISQKEWAGLLSVYNVSSVYAPLVFPKLDANQDGFLSKEEVLALIREFFYSDDPEAPANAMFGPY